MKTINFALLLILIHNAMLTSSERTLARYKSVQEIQDSCFDLLNQLDQQPICTIPQYPIEYEKQNSHLFNLLYGDEIDDCVVDNNEKNQTSKYNDTRYKLVPLDRFDGRDRIISMLSSETNKRLIPEKHRCFSGLWGTSYRDIHGNEFRFGIMEDIFPDRTHICSMKELQNMFREIINEFKSAWKQSSLNEHSNAKIINQDENSWQLFAKPHTILNEDCLWRRFIRLLHLDDFAMCQMPTIHNSPFIYLWIKRKHMQQVLEALELQLDHEQVL